LCILEPVQRAFLIALATTAAAGCHIIFPYSPSGSDGRRDAPIEAGFPVDRARDSAAFDGTHDRHPGDGPRADSSGPPPGAICSPDKWCWENPLPQGATLSGVWGTGAKDVYAVGERGMILHCGGTSLTQLSSGTTENLWAIWGSGPDIFVVGQAGVILHSNGGAWALQPSGTGDSLNAIWGSAGNDVFAVGDNGRIARFNGSAWSSTKIASGSLFGVWGTGPDNVFAVGTGGEIWHYNAVSWTKVFSAGKTLYGIWGSGPGFAIAVGVEGKAVVYNGTSWSASTAPNVPSSETGPPDLYAVWGTSAANVTVVGAGGAAYRYDNAAPAWSKLGSQTAVGLQAIWGTATGSDTFVVGDGGTVLRYTPAGGWDNALSSSRRDELYGVIVQNGISAAVGRSTALLLRQAQTWSAYEVATDGWLEGLWSPSPGTLLATGSGGVILTCTIQGGVSCTPQIWSTKPSLENLWGGGADVWAAGQGGTVLRRGGPSWTAVTGSGTTDLHGVWATPTGAYVVGKKGLVLSCTSAGCSPIQPSPPPTVTSNLWAIWGNGAELFAVGDGGTILTYDASGWRTPASGITAPLFDVVGCGAEVYAVGAEGKILLRRSGVWIPHSSGTASTLYGVWCNAPGDAYAVGQYGTILHRYAP
jgi:hypothetical protein